MQVISADNYQELINEIKGSNLTYGRVGVMGTIHDGHRHIFKEAKKRCNRLVVDFIEYIIIAYRFFRSGALDFRRDTTFEQVIESAKNSELDYLVYSKFDISYIEVLERLRNEFLPKLQNLAKDLNLNFPFPILALVSGVMSDLDKVVHHFVGPKNVLYVEMAKKVGITDFDPEVIWSFYRSDEGYAVYRYRGDPVLGRIAKMAYEELKRGITDYNSLEKLMYEYYIEDPKFSIIDLKDLKRINCISDNCALVFQNSSKSDIIYIKDGEVIY